MADAKLELLADSSQIVKAEKDLDKLNKTGAKTEGVTAKAGSSMKGLGRNAGQAGVQIQQFVGQVQGGQSALLALSQQGADLGIVLGQAGLGAAVGIAAAAISFLIMDTEEAASATDRLKESMDALSEISVESTGGVRELGEEIRQLAEYSEQAARAKITLGLIEAEKASKAAADSVRDLLGGLDADFGFSGIDTYIDQLSNAEAVTSRFTTVTSEGFKEVSRELGEELGLTGEAAQKAGSEIILAAAKAKEFGTPDALNAFNDALLNAQANAPKASQEFNELVGRAQEFFSQARTAAESAEFLSGALDNMEGKFEGTAEANEKSSANMDRVSESLRRQIIELTEGAKAAEVYAVTQAAIANGQQEQLPALLKLVDRKYEAIEADQDAKREAKELAEAQKEYSKVLDQIFKNTDKQTDADKRAAEARERNFESLKQSIVLQQDQLRLNNDQYELRKNLLALGPDASDEQIRQITNLTNSMQQLRLEAELIGPTLQESFADIGVNAIGSMSDALASALVNSESLDEAFANVAKTITTSLISAVIEYGARQAAFYALDAAGFIATESTKTAAVTTATATQTAAATAAIGTLTAAQVASGTAITAAMAPAAAATSVATAGAAPAAAAPIALGSIGAIIAALVGGLALGSTFGRALGGQVNRNQPYLVGERGPELFTPNSSGNGRITPFNQLVNSQGGNGETVNKTANITFALPEGNADFRQRVSQNRDLFYNIVQQAMNDRGMRMGGRR